MKKLGAGRRFFHILVSGGRRKEEAVESGKKRDKLRSKKPKPPQDSIQQPINLKANALTTRPKPH